MEKNDFGKSREGPYGCFGFTGLKWLNTVGWLTFFGTGKCQNLKFIKSFKIKAEVLNDIFVSVLCSL